MVKLEYHEQVQAHNMVIEHTDGQPFFITNTQN